MSTETLEKKPHLGRNVQRIREMVGIKQNTLALNTGLSQQYISKLEQSEEIPEDLLEKLAQGLGVTVDLIRKFNEEKAIYNIQSNITINEHGTNQQNFKPTINNNPADQIVELFEKLLQSEKEKVELLIHANKAILELTEQIRAMKK